MYLVLVFHWSHSFGQTEAGEHYSYGQRVEAVVPLKHLGDAWPLVKATRPHLFESDPVLPHLRKERVLDKKAFMESVQRAKRELENGRERFHVAYAYMTGEASSQGEKWYLVKDALLLEQGTHYDSANLAYQRAMLGR